MTDLSIPLSTIEQKFVRSFIKTGNLRKTSIYCRLSSEAGKRMFRRPGVRREIDRRIGMIEREQTHLEARERAWINQMLDRELESACRLNPQTHGATKLNALRLAYVVTGRIVDSDVSAMKVHKTKTSEAAITLGIQTDSA